MVYAFWISMAFCLYTFAGYPACLALLAYLRRLEVHSASVTPKVSILISVRSAEPIIEQKLRDCLAQDYPQDKMEIWVICDGPSPKTAEIAARLNAPNIHVIQREQQGKSAALGAGLAESTGEIVIFTDAAVGMDHDGVRTIVRNFADPSVGCVTSEDRIRSQDANAEPVYISVEMLLRRMEARAGTLVNASGAFFAIRRGLCERWHTDMSSDFFLPLRTIEQGMRVIVDPQVKNYLEAGKSDREFARKLRTIVHGLDVLWRHRRLLNPLSYGVAAWQLASHKLFRWLLPFAFLIILASSAALSPSAYFYRLVFAAQLLVYGAGAVGCVSEKARGWLIFRIPGFFVLGTVATLEAWREFLSGERYLTWQPTQR